MATHQNQIRHQGFTGKNEKTLARRYVHNRDFFQYVHAAILLRRVYLIALFLLLYGSAACSGLRIQSPIGGPRPAPSPSTAPVLTPAQAVFSDYHPTLKTAVTTRLSFLRLAGVAHRHKLIGDDTARTIERMGEVARVSIDQAIDALTTYLSISDPAFPDKSRLLWAISQVNQTMLNLQLELAKQGLIK